MDQWDSEKIFIYHQKSIKLYEMIINCPDERHLEQPRNGKKLSHPTLTNGR